MKLRHFTDVYSDYDFVDVKNEGEDIETWTYDVYIDNDYNQVIEIEFEIHHAPKHKVELIRAITIQYGKNIKPCLMCGSMNMKAFHGYDSERNQDKTQRCYLHECGFTNDELIDLAIEVYIDDNFDDIMTQEKFDNDFVIEKISGNTIYLYETYSSNRYIVKNNKVYHYLPHGINAEECPFCESKEFALYNKEGMFMKCSVLTKNIHSFIQLIKNSNKKASNIN